VGADWVGGARRPVGKGASGGSGRTAAGAVADRLRLAEPRRCLLLRPAGSTSQESLAWTGATCASAATRRLDDPQQDRVEQAQPDAKRRPRPLRLYLRGRLPAGAAARLLLRPRRCTGASQDDEEDG